MLQRAALTLFNPSTNIPQDLFEICNCAALNCRCGARPLDTLKLIFLNFALPFGDVQPVLAQISEASDYTFLETWKMSEAEELLKLMSEYCVERKENALYAKPLGNLGRVYIETGQMDLAQTATFESQGMLSQIYRDSTAKTATLNSQLADIYRHQGQLEAAEELYNTVISTLTFQFGKYHPYISRCLYGLGEIYCATGRQSELLAISKRNLDLSLHQLAEENIDTALTYLQLASCYVGEKSLIKADHCFNQAANIHERLLGEANFITALSYTALGKICLLQEQPAKAEMMLNMGYRVLKQTDKKNFFTAYCADILGCAYSRNGNFLQAKELHLKSWQDFSNLYGDISPFWKSSVLSDLTKDYLLLKDLPEAEVLLQQLLNSHTQLQRPLPPDILSVAFKVVTASLQVGWRKLKR